LLAVLDAAALRARVAMELSDCAIGHRLSKPTDGD
jgi:hypothetical protein